MDDITRRTQKLHPEPHHAHNRGQGKNGPLPCPAAGKPAGSGDDSLLAALYMRMWAMASGHPLPRDVPPGELTEEELVSFWADDFRQHTARHAATAGGRK